MINRKLLDDEDGEDLARALKYNERIEKISLENNLLGPRFLVALADTLRHNKYIKYIDLEGNSLTGGNNEEGIKALFEALKENDTLVSLNLNNTSLTSRSGLDIKRGMQNNKKIIMLDIEKNPDLELDDVRDI